MKQFQKYFVCGLAACLFGAGVQAQTPSCHPSEENVLDRLDFRADWQVNAPLGTHFADQLSGWGMNLEFTYELAPRWEAGVFASFHTNHRYVGRETIQLSPTEHLTTDQSRSLFQLPFGLTASYAFSRNRHFRPYAGLKLGALYSRCTTYTGLDGWYDRNWGFYASPEVGLEIFPFRHCGTGFRLSAYYGYGTNQGHHLTGTLEGLDNLGFRIGIVF